MAVTVRDLLNLDIMKNFKVVAGAQGMDNIIKATEILDFEFVLDNDDYRDKIFEGDSIVLSSLLFAKDDPDLILQAVKRLVALNVRTLAYKPVFYKELPKEVLDYANRTRFPILEFGDDEFFEEIIFSIHNLIDRDETIGITEPLFEAMIKHDVDSREAEEMHEQINPFFRPFVTAFCLKIEGMDEDKIMELICRGKPNERLRGKIFVGKYEDKFIMILSQDEPNLSKVTAMLEDVKIAYGLVGKEMITGVSTMRSLGDHFDKAVKEAYWAEKVAEIENVSEKNYRELGIYKLIVAHMNSLDTTAYMHEYLSPLFEEEEKEGDLLQTAIAYVQAKGDMLKTASQLYCHKNTIRYRIGKLQEKLDPESNEKEFYQNLATAVKIYLLLETAKG